MPHDIPDGRNISEARRAWDSGITFRRGSNTYNLVRALLSEADRIDDDLDDIYHAQHIETATGDDLDKFGQLADVPRNSGEPDDKYRARIKAEFAQAKSTGTFDRFVEFSAEVLNTSVNNIEISTIYDSDPATVTLSAYSDVFDTLNLTNQEVVDILNGGVAAGHEVKVNERGTFRLKADGDTDDASKGLTSDSISTGGTLAADLL